MSKGVVRGEWTRTQRALGAAACSVLVMLLVTATAQAQLTPADIAELEARGRAEGWTFTVGLNPATQYSMDQLCGAIPPDASEQGDEPAASALPPARSLPDYFDWRDHGCCTPVRNQGGCGSCWAFGAIGAMEQAILLNAGVSVDLSEQWLVSCTSAGDCGGGMHTEAFKHLVRGGYTDGCHEGGAVLESDLPYVAWNAPCDCPYPHPFYLDDWDQIFNMVAPVADIKQTIMDHGPVAVGVRVTSPFQGYNGGVFNACSSGNINHIVVLTGWDDNQGSNGVWFLRNSWGSGWGEGGYMRIEYGCSEIGTSTCYVEFQMENCNANDFPDEFDLAMGYSADCDVNSIPDECDIAQGGSSDCNGNTIADACDVDPFTLTDPWSMFDALEEGIGYDPTGYHGIVSDGRYLYFVPRHARAFMHGEVLRFDTLGGFDDPGAWTSFDAGAHGVGLDPDGYRGGAFDGRYVYFAPFHNGTSYHAEVLRLDTQGVFGDVSAWTTVDPQTLGVPGPLGGYEGTVYDGRYVYFVPYYNGSSFSGEVLRYDTLGDFAAAEAWTAYTPDVGVDVGYRCGVYDGRYVYFVPGVSTGDDRGRVLRLDTQGTFADPASWTAFDPGAQGVGVDPDGFWGGVFDGQYVYFAPNHNGDAYSGEVLRYDTLGSFTDVAAWETFAPADAGVGLSPKGFVGAVFDGQFVYFVPHYNGTSYNAEVLRYNTHRPFDTAQAWSAFDPGAHGLGYRVMGYNGGYFDGQYLYFAPYRNTYEYHGKVLRLEVQPQVHSTDCNANLVPDECELMTLGDFDGNGRTDLVDFTGFVGCMGQPTATPEPGDPQCVSSCLTAFDFDADGDVDMDDFADLQLMFSGS